MMTETPERPKTALERDARSLDDYANEVESEMTEAVLRGAAKRLRALASSLGEPVSQEAPVPDTLTKQSRHCNMCDRPEVCDRILPNTGPCGMNDGTPVISSASPLSEGDKRFLRGFVEDYSRGHFLRDRLLDIVSRLSASAPSPEDNGSEL